MTVTKFNRDDPASAAQVMRKLCSSKAEQRLVLTQLLRSIAIAEQLAPHSWAVTLFPKGFRLNVGKVEVFTFFDEIVGMFFLGSIPIDIKKIGEVRPTQYRSMPQPQHGFFGSVAEFGKANSALGPVHAEFVRTAAVTPRGAPRRSSFARTHSPGLHTYAQHIAGL